MKWLALTLLATPGAALAQDRDYCPTRPGLGTPACTIAPGKVSVETDLVDWERDDQPDSRTDTVLIGDTQVRVGISDTTEILVDWTPFGIVRERDKATGAVDRRGRVGDVVLGFKTSLANPDGSGLSVAILPTVTVPVGRVAVGGGDWAAGLLAPVTYDLSDRLNVQLTPEIDAAVDEDHRGRHLAYSAVVGLGYKLTDAVTLEAEYQAVRDDDPAGHATQSLAALSVGWMANDDTQLDLGGAAGLNHDTPDARLYAGVSRRF